MFFLFIILHEGSLVYPPTICMQATPKQLFFINSEDPDEMPHNAAFHRR